MYDVALLIERALNPLDVDQIISLHEGLDDSVTYHVLLPVESSASLMAASMGAIGGQMMPLTEPSLIDEVQDEIVRSGQEELDATAELFAAKDALVTTQLTEDDPVDALAELVTSTSAAEAIILTQSHVVQEFFHVDWTSRAKRRLHVPTLHLLEHVPFSAQR
ncbi:MAG TPA: hypothetical protein VNZ66_05155 [Aeromicrobium sp.]|nr:hypothetical protein [Aeromicrobium sp.]